MTTRPTRRLRAADIDDAVALLAGGGLVAVPTETVYGLAADGTDPDAVAGIFEAKGRPLGHPLILHLAEPVDLDRWRTGDDPRPAALAAAFWPGPLTMIVPRATDVLDVVTGDRPTVGLRVPDHDLTREVIRRLGRPVAAPSANSYGAVSPTSAEHVLGDLAGRIDAVLDGGESRVGVESTIVELVPGAPPTLLRPGGISEVEIEAVLGEPVVDGLAGPSRAAGMVVSHYAPSATVVVVDDAGAAGPDDGLLTPEGRPTGGAGRIERLPAEPSGYAAGLYRALRALDATGVARILVVPPDAGPMRPAVLDRLRKAAAPR